MSDFPIQIPTPTVPAIPPVPVTPPTQVPGMVPSGQAGLNAYQLAVLGAPGVPPFVGTMADWLLAQKGENGSNIELQLGTTHIQWRVAGTADAWSNLVAIADLKGQDSTVPGPSVDLRIDSGNVQWQVAGSNNWQNLITVAEITGADSTVPGPAIELRVDGGNIEWSVSGANSWTPIVALVDLTGADSTVPGPSIELRVNGTDIEWQVAGTGSWAVLVPMADITGPAGTEVLVDPVRTTIVGNDSAGPFAVTGAAGLTNPAALLVAIDGVLQEPGVDYTVGGGQITFSEPLLNGSKAVVISPVNSLQVGQVTPSDGSVTSAKLDANLAISGTFEAGSFAGATLNLSGDAAMGGQVLLLGQTLTAPESAVSRVLGDARYQAKTIYTSTAQVNAVTNTGARQDITGLTGIAVEGGALYCLEFFGRVTTTGGSVYISLEGASTFSPNGHHANVSQGVIAGAAFIGGYANSGTWVDFLCRLANTTGTYGGWTRMLFSTATNNTLKLTLAQSGTAVGTTSLLAGAKLVVTKL